MLLQIDFADLLTFMKDLFSCENLPLYATTISIRFIGSNNDKNGITWYYETEKPEIAQNSTKSIDIRRILEKFAQYYIGKGFIINMIAISIYLPSVTFSEIFENHEYLINQDNVRYSQIIQGVQSNIQVIRKFE
jgi:hypothetical protein